mgnify:CR=1 FL=1
MATHSALYKAPFGPGGASEVDVKMAEQLLSIALDKGADYADLFFEYRAAGGLVYDEGIPAWKEAKLPLEGNPLPQVDLVKIALGQFDLGPAAAMSLIYFAITLFVSWLFYTLMTRNDAK